MIYGLTKTKPRLAGRGFAQSTCGLFAIAPYRIGYAGATDRLSLLPVAFDGAGNGKTLLRGALP